MSKFEDFQTAESNISELEKEKQRTMSLERENDELKEELDMSKAEIMQLRHLVKLLNHEIARICGEIEEDEEDEPEPLGGFKEIFDFVPKPKRPPNVTFNFPRLRL